MNFRSVKHSFIFYIQALWEATKKVQHLSWGGRLAFSFLRCLERIYSICFLFDQARRRLVGGFAVDHCKVISVGNLTVGGTGKSVVVSFLVEHLGADLCAIALRGYGRTPKKDKNLLISDGARVLVGVESAGDEAIMHARRCGCSVAVGGDRKRSWQLLAARLTKKPRYLILDDAYQNHQIKKDFEILLLDARFPFDNGHCLPAGRLREKDYRRAHMIMLTHADCVSLAELSKTKEQLSRDFSASNIVCVRHAMRDILCASGQRIERSLLGGKQFLVFAGIGSFESFVQGVCSLGILVGKTIEFADHHNYDESDLQRILSFTVEDKLDAILTTAKDWTKIEPLLEKNHKNQRSVFFIAPVSIEFLSQQEYSHFIAGLHEKIN